MTKLTKISIALLFGLSFGSCSMTKSEKDNYSKDPKISNSLGIPKDSMTFYFPTSIRQDTSIVKTEIDTFMLNWFSSDLYSAKEPILFNYYLGHDIYRFLWLRAFHRPVVISIHKDREKIWLVTKILDKQPEFEVAPPPPPPTLPNESNLQPDVNVETFEPETEIREPDRQANIVYNQIKTLTKKDWTEFETLLLNISFWTTKPSFEILGHDGSFWIFEGHLKNMYWYVVKWYPEDGFKTLGEYLIKKSELKETIY